MVGVAVGQALGMVALAVVVARALRGLPVPVWAAAIGPLLQLVAVRWAFAEVDPTTPPAQLAELHRLAADVARLTTAGGFAAWLAGIASRWRGSGAPGLSQVGAVSVAFGVVWASWAEGAAALWEAAAAPLATLEALRAQHGAHLGEAANLAAVVMLVGWLPVAVWGLVRERWPGLGDGVAGAMLVLLTLRTGQPAREAGVALDAAWTAGCPAACADAPPPGDVDARTLPRRLLPRDGVAPLGADVVWEVPAGGAPEALAALPPDALVAGCAAAPVPREVFDRHPAVAAARCRATTASAAKRGVTTGPPAP